MRLVVKLSGKVLEETGLRGSLCRQVRKLSLEGHQLALVHGAGKQLTEFCRQLGIPVVQRQGRRVTDPATLEAAKKVFSSLNADLTAHLLAEQVAAVGLSGFDGFLTRSRRRPPLAIRDGESVELVDFGLVGEIESSDARLIETLWAGAFVPVISSLCADPAGSILNINADTLATELAISLKADRLVGVSDVDGIFKNPADPATRIPCLTTSEARALMTSGAFKEGMIPKIESALKSVESGVTAYQLIGGDQEGALAQCLTGDSGTTLTAG